MATKMASNTSSEPLCPNWIFSNTSNVHVCKNRGWFTDYTPFQSTVGSLYFSEAIPVLGVGTVIIPTKRSPARTGRDSHGQLVLHDVLHVPSIFCNIFGLTERDSHYDVILGKSPSSPNSLGRVVDTQKRSIAYFDASQRLFQLKLSGPPTGPVVGPSVFRPNGHYSLNAHWAASELARWEAYKQGGQNLTIDAGEHSSALPGENPTGGYTEEEKAWLKTHYGGEFKFLRMYGLSINDDEEREEGKAIARVIIANDQAKSPEESEDEGSDKVDEESDEGEEEDYEDNFEGRMADYMFDERSLRWINKHYGTSMNFMYSYGLKFYDEDDCKEAAHLVKVLMEN